MNLYTETWTGAYTMKTPNFDGTFREQQVEVEVLGESVKSYLVKVRVPVRGRKAGESFPVRKHNVRRRDARPIERRVYDYTKAFWNN